MGWAKAKRVALFLIVIAVVIVVSLFRLRNNGLIFSVRTPEGASVTIVEYHFQPGKTRYDLYERFGRYGKMLPSSILQKLGIKPYVVITTFPTNQPGLSVALRPTLKDTSSFLRLIVSDEHGNEYDEAVHSGAWDQFWVKEVNAFPRRGKELHLKLAIQTNIFPPLIIRNPDPGPHPVWKAEALPVSSTNSKVEVKLVKFRAMHTDKVPFGSQGYFPKTEFGFHVFEDGIAVNHWKPISLQIIDATGNKWQPYRKNRESTNGTQAIEVTLLGALWKGEEAWKVKADFVKFGEFKGNELVTLKVTVPDAQEIIEPSIRTIHDGVNVDVLAVIGRDVKHDRIYRWNPERVQNSVTILIKGEIIAENRRLEFVRAFDDRGRDIPLMGQLEQGDTFPELNTRLAAERKKSQS